MDTRYPRRLFTALTDCPQCGTTTVHPWHLPPAEDQDMDTDADREAEAADIINWGGATVHVWKTLVRYRADHTTCDVIRECARCRTHWPER